MTLFKYHIFFVPFLLRRISLGWWFMCLIKKGFFFFSIQWKKVGRVLEKWNIIQDKIEKIGDNGFYAVTKIKFEAHDDDRMSLLNEMQTLKMEFKTAKKEKIERIKLNKLMFILRHFKWNLSSFIIKVTLFTSFSN